MNDIHALSGAYAVDAVDDVERAEFERHLADCPACQAEVASFRATAEKLSLMVNASPPERLREQVLHDIALVRPLAPEVGREAAQRIEDRGRASDSKGAQASSPQASAGSNAEVTSITSRAQQRRVVGRQRANRWLAAAAAVAVLGGGTVAVLHPWDRQSQTQVSLADRVLQAPDAQRFSQAVATGGSATVIRSKSLGKAVLVTDNLPPPPSGKVYQLWLETPSTSMASAGLLPSAGDQTVVLEGDAASALGAGITVEPAGGSPQPTTTPVALIGFA